MSLGKEKLQIKDESIEFFSKLQNITFNQFLAVKILPY